MMHHDITIKKKKTFTFDRIWCAFIDLGLYGSFHWFSFGSHVTHDFSSVLEYIWVLVNQHLLSNLNAMPFLVEIEPFWHEFRGDSTRAQIIG